MTEENPERAAHFEKMKEPISEHARKIGEATIAWNYFHVVLALWYAHIASPTSNIAQAIRDWDTIKSDHDQRKLLVAALKTNRAKIPRHYDSMIWVCEWVNELAPIRNAFVHLATVVRGLPDNPQVEFIEQLHLTGPDDRFAHVKAKPDESYDALMHDVMELSEFVHRSFNNQTIPATFPVPERPELKLPKVHPGNKPKSLA